MREFLQRKLPFAHGKANLKILQQSKLTFTFWLVNVKFSYLGSQNSRQISRSSESCFMASGDHPSLAKYAVGNP